MSTEAKWYSLLPEGKVQCTLCPHFCILKDGKAGICKARINKGGKLVSEVYSHVSAIHFDPIEKKPLNHFYPGSTILSLGTYGCNLKCIFCQNCSISQTDADPALLRNANSPEQIIQLALQQSDNIGIAFTYNEPVVWFEYMYDIARLAKKAGLKTVMVTNGFINPEPLQSLLEYIDAFSVDLKAFSNDFYTKYTSSELEPVKSALKQISLAGKHLEIVNLVIPGLNDDETSFKEMIRWIANELGRDTVLHISRYFPSYKLTVEATPLSTLTRLKHIAESELTYVYTGNIDAESNQTLCKYCNNILITRQLYITNIVGLDTNGKCIVCNKEFLKKT